MVNLMMMKMKDKIAAQDEQILKLNNKIIDLEQENEELKLQLKGTTFCYDEEEHKRLQEENKELKKQLEIKHNGFMASVEEACELAKENQKYKEVIDKSIEYIESHKRKDEFLELNEWQTRNLLDILKEVYR